MITAFISYSHKDEGFRNQLQTHLAMLRREGKIEVWHDRRIVPGESFDSVIDSHIETSDLFLLLISPDFLASEYCYDIEMKRALERHAAGQAVVIPIILRPCDWSRTPFARIQSLPGDAKPISKWPDQDDAFLDVVTGIRRAIEQLEKLRGVLMTAHAPVVTLIPPRQKSESRIRSSNLRVRREFSDKDRDQFLADSFEHISNYIEGSLEELNKRYADIEHRFTRIDSTHFTASIYRDGKRLSVCKIWIGSGHSRGEIMYSSGDNTGDNSWNASVSVTDNGDYLVFSAELLRYGGGERDKHLSAEGVAEEYWAMLIEPLQR